MDCIRIIGVLLGIVGAFILWKSIHFIYEELTSPLRALPGPPSPSLIYGNMKQVWDAEGMEMHEKWVEEYGSAIKYKSFFGESRFYTTDTKALNHILMNTSSYEKPTNAKFILTELFGDGLLIVEGEKHRQHRKVMNPAFGVAQLRELTGIIVEKSLELRDVWANEIQKPESDRKINALSWLSRMTLDVIGLAGFNYNFGALTDDPAENELNQAFQLIFRTGTRLNMRTLLRNSFPLLRSIIPNDKTAHAKVARETMARIGNKLLRDSHAAIRAENEVVEKSTWKRKDLLSVLMRANMATDLPPSQRMSNDEVLAQIPTFLVAGHETTSTATTWALYLLTQHPDIQTKLRKELLSISTDTPTMDELNDIPYLDAVVREVLRFNPPVPSSMRVAVKDDVLPLAKPVRTRTGELINEIQIRKGQTLVIPILAINRSLQIWGPDARIFKPERWLEKLPESVSAVPGIWGNMLTFLGGPRACIGYRFSLIEIKALLFTLVRAFEFELAVSPKEIIRKTMIIQRPIVVTEKENGNQMPLRLKLVQRQ